MLSRDLIIKLIDLVLLLQSNNNFVVQDDGRINDFKTSSYAEKKEHHRVSDFRSGTSNRPEKTFYFGDENTQRRNYRNDRQEYLNQQNTQQKNYSVEKDSNIKELLKSNKQNIYRSSDDWKDSGYMSANVKTRTFSSLNDRVINDSKTNENFERSFKDDFERIDAHQDLNRLMDKSWVSHSRLYNCH